MRTIIFKSGMASLFLAISLGAAPSHHQLEQLSRAELITLIRAQHSRIEQLEKQQARSNLVLGLKSTVFGMAVTYAGLWWFNIHPRKILKGLL